MNGSKIGVLDSLDYIIEVEARFINAKNGKILRAGKFRIGCRDFNPQDREVQIIGFPEAETSNAFLKRVITEAKFVRSLATHAKSLAEMQLKVKVK